VDAKIGPPQVSYREKITRPATVDYVHKKQSGGSGQYARCKIIFEPIEDEDEVEKDEKSVTDIDGSSGLPPPPPDSVTGKKVHGATKFEFANEIKGGAIPKEYIPGVQKGIESVLSNGVVAGYPVLGLRARLIDGSYHDVDSSQLAFEIAGRSAAREGLRKAGARLMEPLMQVDVTCPEEYMGDILGDINSRRGMVTDLGDRGNAKTVAAVVPLAEMFQYVSTLRSMSKGRAQYSMVLSKYEIVPTHVEKEITAGRNGGAEEEE